MNIDNFIYAHHKAVWVRMFRGPLNIARRFCRKYRIILGEKIGLPVPREFTMKLEWLKHFDKNPLMPEYADKVEVKRHMSKIIGDEFLIKTLGVYDKASEIDFDKLPNKFVLKTNNASGTNIIVADKSKLDIDSAREKLDLWLKQKFGEKEHEWQYLQIKPKILCEEFIETEDGELSDFKFFCLNGKVRFAWKDIGRFTKNKARAIFDAGWNRIPMTLFTRNYEGDVPKPKNYEKMVEIAEKISQPFKEVRVDLYNVDGKIYFGETTFFSGDLFFRPRKYNKIWGDMLDLGIERRSER
ncbi:MAG: hypothetical protein J6P03_00705 [Opitutales bacterium]|nr:hypothetical protein [Opitutales bacterium]